MDLTAFTRDINLLSPLFLLLLFLFLLILKQVSSKAQNIPPGPRQWPLIGNILQMGKKPHISMTHFAQAYGPLISLRLGTQLLIVGSSPEAATEILKTHDRLLSARYVPQVTIPDLRPISLVWAAECGDQWKSLRTLFRTELFSAKAIESQSTLRQRKVAELLEFLSTKEEKVVNIGEVVFSTIFNTLGNICFSKDFIDLEDKGMASGMKGLIRTMMEMGTTPNIADFYPIFEHLDLQGLRKKASKHLKKVFEVWEILIKERRESNGLHGSKQEDFLDCMLASGFSDLEINNTALEIFAAGTDTTSSTTEWAMSELLKNKQAMDRVREELKREITTSDHSINETDLSRLPYLHACVKETLRLHPPAPFLLPHLAQETCEVMNYTIPKNSQVLVNVWAIARDPKIWEDPLSFKPERFLDSNLDFRGQDFEFLPFGAGRRMCPGLPFATVQVHLILASLVHRFEWFLPENRDPSELDMEEKFGTTLQKEQPLILIPKQSW